MDAGSSFGRGKCQTAIEAAELKGNCPNCVVKIAGILVDTRMSICMITRRDSVSLLKARAHVARDKLNSKTNLSK